MTDRRRLLRRTRLFCATCGVELSASACRPAKARRRGDAPPRCQSCARRANLARSPHPPPTRACLVAAEHARARLRREPLERELVALVGALRLAGLRRVLEHARAIVEAQNAGASP